uniref:Uncharacterized protein n=1 Tax=Quercus lobata TaxID=97700 RepID=A0A7N2LLT9_QUELO
MISGDASFDSGNTISDRCLTVKFGSSFIRFTRFYRSTTGGMILNPNDSGRVQVHFKPDSPDPWTALHSTLHNGDGSPPRQRVDRKREK